MYQLNYYYKSPMGSEESIQYSVDVPGQEQPKDSTKVKRHPRNVDKLHEYSPKTGLKTMRDVLINSYKLYPKNNCLGSISLYLGTIST